MSIAAMMDLVIDQLDVVSAFLNGLIDCMVYLRQPEGFMLSDGDVCLLKKSLYGLYQVARDWYLVLDGALIQVGFIRLDADLAVWVRIKERIQFVIGHVDDMLNIGFRADVDEVKAFLSTKFKLKDLRPAGVFVGLSIVRNREKKKIYISLAHYATEILETFNMIHCNPISVPYVPGMVLHKSTHEVSPPLKKLYQGTVGSLGDLMTCIRPNIAYAVNKLAQFASCLGEEHLQAVKHILIYIKGTMNTKIVISLIEKV